MKTAGSVNTNTTHTSCVLDYVFVNLVLRKSITQSRTLPERCGNDVRDHQLQGRRRKTDLDQSMKSPNDNGNNELRLARVTKRGNGHEVQFLDCELDQAEALELINEFKLDLNPDQTQYANLKTACRTIRYASEKKCHILLYVHVYSSDIRYLMNAALDLVSRYEVEVISFTWPASGGGVGVKLSYLDDKRDASASTGALERALKQVCVKAVSTRATTSP